MRPIKRFFTAYSIDYWVFILIAGILTAAACYVNDSVGTYESRISILLFAFMTVLCVTLTQTHRKHKASPLSWLSSKAGERFASTLSPIRLNNYQAHILILSTLFVVYFVRTLYRVISGKPPVILLVYAVFLALIFLALYIGIRRSFTERFARFLVWISMIYPVLLDLMLEKSSTGHSPYAYIWLLISVVFSMFMVSKRAPGMFFKLFICLLFLGMIAEMIFYPDIEVVNMLELISNVFSTGFVIFASLEFYTSHSTKNYQTLEDIYEELKNTQTQLIQREQMVTLGQLIAGVSHEINTPIGAIKASAEMLDSFDLGRVFRHIRRFSDDDLDAILTMLDLSTNSVKSMRSTVELRRGKTQMLAYLERMGVASAKEINLLLSSMEICDIEKIADNIDLFRRDNILELLQSVRELYTYISGVQRIRFACDNITKIIFALKSFSHMNTSGEVHDFDVIKNIDNVLVLYQNQLKRGVEIVKHYDDNVPLVHGNMEEIGQVWTNIAQNAIHAMSYVGKLTICVKNMIDWVEISFTDTGAGISPENLAKIFDPFFTTKPLGEGSGLGLDICHKIITKHNGTITVNSTLGQGSTFTVTLPVKHMDTEMFRV